MSSRNISSIQLSGKDTPNCHELWTDFTDVKVSDASGVGSGFPATNRVEVKPLTKFEWKAKYYWGRLVATHTDNVHLAYAIAGGSGKGGSVRVMNRNSNQRVLIKFEGSVSDIAFAYLQSVILAIIDNTGFVGVYNIRGGASEDTKLIATPLLLVQCCEGKVPTEFRRIVWCPYVPDPPEEGTATAETNGDDDGDMSREGRYKLTNDSTGKLLLITCDNIAYFLYVDIVASRYNQRVAVVSNISTGLITIQSHSKEIVDATISPDAEALATVSLDGTIKFFNVSAQYDPTAKTRCLHNWVPHSEQPLTSILFLDNHKQPHPESVFWRYAITGAKFNQEIKLWTCETWTCLQTITFSASPHSDAPLFQLKSALDLSASYLLLSDISRKVLYVLDISHDEPPIEGQPSTGTSARLSNIAEYVLASPCLNFALSNAEFERNCVTPSEENHHEGEGEEGIHENKEVAAITASASGADISGTGHETSGGTSSSVVRLTMFGIFPRALQELRVKFDKSPPEEEEEDGVAAVERIDAEMAVVDGRKDEVEAEEEMEEGEIDDDEEEEDNEHLGIFPPRLTMATETNGASSDLSVITDGSESWHTVPGSTSLNTSKSPNKLPIGTGGGATNSTPGGASGASVLLTPEAFTTSSAIEITPSSSGGRTIVHRTSGASGEISGSVTHVGTGGGGALTDDEVNSSCQTISSSSLDHITSLGSSANTTITSSVKQEPHHFGRGESSPHHLHQHLSTSVGAPSNVTDLLPIVRPAPAQEHLPTVTAATTASKSFSSSPVSAMSHQGIQAKKLRLQGENGRDDTVHSTSSSSVIPVPVGQLVDLDSDINMSPAVAAAAAATAATDPTDQPLDVGGSRVPASAVENSPYVIPHRRIGQENPSGGSGRSSSSPLDSRLRAQQSSSRGLAAAGHDDEIMDVSMLPGSQQQDLQEKLHKALLLQNNSRHPHQQISSAAVANVTSTADSDVEDNIDTESRGEQLRVKSHHHKKHRGQPRTSSSTDHQQQQQLLHRLDHESSSSPATRNTTAIEDTATRGGADTSGQQQTQNFEALSKNVESLAEIVLNQQRQISQLLQTLNENKRGQEENVREIMNKLDTIITTAAATSQSQPSATSTAAAAAEQLETLLSMINESVAKSASSASAAAGDSAISATSSAVSEAVNRVLSSQLEKIVSSHLEKIIKSQFTQHVTPSLCKAMDPLKDRFHSDVSQKLSASEAVIKESLHKMVKSKQVIDCLGVAASNSVQAFIQKDIRAMFLETILPSFEESCNSMLNQLNHTFQEGTTEYIKQVEVYLADAKNPQLVRHEALVKELRSSLSSIEENVTKTSAFVKQNEALLTNAKHAISSNLSAHSQKLQTMLASDRVQIAKEVRVVIAEENQELASNFAEHIRSRACTPTPESSRGAGGLGGPSPEENRETRQKLVKANITKLLKEGQLDKAFQLALGSTDLEIVNYICDMVNPGQIFDQQPCPLNQAVLLSLISQLASDINNQTETKAAYLQEAVLNLDINDDVTKKHVESVVQDLVDRLQAYINANPSGGRLTREFNLLKKAAMYVLTRA